jgi:hypothetical protein
MEPSKNSRRAAEIGAGLLVRDAANFGIYTFGLIPHPPCVAIENVSGANLTVGLVAPVQSGDWEYAVTTVGNTNIKPYQSMMELKLSAATAAYSTRTLTISSVTSGAYYLIVSQIKDAPAATTTIAIEKEDALLVTNGIEQEGDIAYTFTKKGVTSLLVKATDTAIVATLGGGISASTDATTPTFKAYRVLAWGLQELNIVY